MLTDVAGGPIFDLVGRSLAQPSEAAAAGTQGTPSTPTGPRAVRGQLGTPHPVRGGTLTLGDTDGTSDASFARRRAARGGRAPDRRRTGRSLPMPSLGLAGASDGRDATRSADGPGDASAVSDSGHRDGRRDRRPARRTRRTTERGLATGLESGLAPVTGTRRREGCDAGGPGARDVSRTRPPRRRRPDAHGSQSPAA